MKKGLIGPYQLGILSGASDILKVAEQITGEHGVDVEGIFYATAFQAGVDEFLIPDYKDHPYPRSDFLANRTTVIPRERSEQHEKMVRATFSAHLPDDWYRNDEYAFAFELQAFVVDLLDAMSTGASLLSPWGMPEIAEAKARLPSELSVPLANLLSAFTDFQASSPIPQKAVPTEDIQRFNEIISSDLFSKYAAAQSSLDDLEAPVTAVLPTVVSSGRDVFFQNKQLLQLRKSSLSILQLTPKLVDVVFGKLPGALAEVAANFGISLLESRRRIVIYDFRSSIQGILFSNLLRMMKAAEFKDKNESPESAKQSQPRMMARVRRISAGRLRTYFAQTSERVVIA